MLEAMVMMRREYFTRVDGRIENGMIGCVAACCYDVNVCFSLAWARVIAM